MLVHSAIVIQTAFEFYDKQEGNEFLAESWKIELREMGDLCDVKGEPRGKRLCRTRL